MSKRIGVVTGGGDCPGLNAVIRAVAKASAKRDWECMGSLGATKVCSNRAKRFRSTTKGLADCYRAAERFWGRRTAENFSAKVGHGESRALPKELLEGVKAGMDAFGLFALVCIGGDGTLSIAQQLFELRDSDRRRAEDHRQRFGRKRFSRLDLIPPSRPRPTRWIVFTPPLKAITALWCLK